MDRATLNRLAQSGFETVTGDELSTLAPWCRDWCEATGDGRYCIISDALASIDTWWSDHNDSVPAKLLEEISAVLRRDLPAVLSEDDLSSASMLAATMRRSIAQHLLPVSEWEARGCAHRSS
jgi:hypothetical protein